MVSIEVIFPKLDKRYYLRIDEKLSCEEFRLHVRRIFESPALNIYFLGCKPVDNYGLSLKEIGVTDGTGVIVSDERI